MDNKESDLVDAVMATLETLDVPVTGEMEEMIETAIKAVMTTKHSVDLVDKALFEKIGIAIMNAQAEFNKNPAFPHYARHIGKAAYQAALAAMPSQPALSEGVHCHGCDTNTDARLECHGIRIPHGGDLVENKLLEAAREMVEHAEGKIGIRETRIIYRDCPEVKDLVREVTAFLDGGVSTAGLRRAIEAFTKEQSDV